MAQTLDDRTDHNCNYRQHGDCEDRERRRNVDQQDHITYDQKRLFEKYLQRACHAKLHGLNVVHYAAHHIALARRGKEAHLQTDHFVEHRVAQFLQRADAQVFDQSLRHITEKAREKYHANRYQSQQNEHIFDVVRAADDFVERVVDQLSEVFGRQAKGWHRLDNHLHRVGVEHRFEQGDQHYVGKRVEDRVECYAQKIGHCVACVGVSVGKYSEVCLHSKCKNTV